MIAIRHILVPTDFSEPADAALTYAKGLAAQFGSELHLLHVVATPQVAWATESAAFSWPTLLADLETEAKTQLERQIPEGDPLAGRVTLSTSIGTPVEQILEYAAAHRIDLIVMGTHGRGLVGHMFLGSVAERVVRRASMPVLTVHGVGQASTAEKVTDATAEESTKAAVSR